MTSVEESLTARTPMGSDLAAGVDQVSYYQNIVFTKYNRVVLPLDGYVFWVRADLLNPSALLNSTRLNRARLDQAPSISFPAPTFTAQGSLHYATNRRQDETETYAVNRVVFTSEVEINDLNQVGPTVLYLGTITDPNVTGSDTPVRFAFSDRGSFYQQTNTYHYVGNALYSTMDTQIIDTVSDFDAYNVIVSDSLPVWLGMHGYAPPYPTPWAAPSFPLFPSFLSPVNLPPPYATVQIDETRAIQASPKITSNLSHYQLATEKVRVTLWGTRNYNALDFLDFVNQFSLDTDLIGIMNMPIVRDDKRTQPEIAAIAMKKTIDFEVSYYQTRIANVARQLILSAVPTFIFN